MELSSKKPFPVKIGPITLYCEKMEMQATSNIMVNPTITGQSVITNKSRQVTRITFTGRLYNKEKPLFNSGILNNYNGIENLEIIYKNLKFINCIITNVKTVDAGEDYVDVTVEASTRFSVTLITEVLE